ncbi:MAG: hypothetical protein IJL54_07630 [Prevotella sp.]|nr:hypothetical protein [Prevotella sp.]
MENGKEIIVAKILFCYDTPHMWENGTNRPGLCPVCHNVIEQIPNMDYIVRKNRYRDIAVTYDGFFVVSQKFKAFCDENKYDSLEFVQLPKSPSYYFFAPHKIYELDYIRRGTEFKGYHECCGRFDSIAGCSPAYKHINNNIKNDDFICRSDVFFGSDLNAGPIIIIGMRTLEKIKSYDLSGMYFKNVYL